MGASSSLAMLCTFLHSAVRYTSSASTVKYQGVESTTNTRMNHNCSSLTSSFRLKPPMTTLSFICLWAHHIKAILTIRNLDLQGLKPWPQLPDVHQRLLPIRHPNSHTSFHRMRSPSTINLLSLPLYTLTIYLSLQPRFHPLNPAMQPFTKTQ